MTLHRRSAPTPGEPSSTSKPVDQGTYWGQLPSLLEFLSVSKWEDGSPRATGTAMVFYEGGFWKCWVHDRDAYQGAFLSAQTLDELLLEVEEAVATGKGDWRPDKGSRRK